jgi:hypothetical protein
MHQVPAKNAFLGSAVTQAKGAAWNVAAHHNKRPVPIPGYVD